MSDIEFEKAVTNLIAVSKDTISIESQKPVETVDVSEEEKPKKTEGGWQRTRECACPPTALTDCRFHSQSEPGWEICPHIKDKSKGAVKSRWLWVNTSPQAIDVDPTEAQDALLEAKLAIR